MRSSLLAVGALVGGCSFATNAPGPAAICADVDRSQTWQLRSEPDNADKLRHVADPQDKSYEHLRNREALWLESPAGDLMLCLFDGRPEFERSVTVFSLDRDGEYKVTQKWEVTRVD